MSAQPTTFYSSRTEDLVAKLLLNLTNDEQFFLNQAFGQCTILVPNSGMQRYLELQIARTFGICSHIQIIYPGKFLWQLYQRVLPEVVAPDSLDTRQLTFQLLALWQSCHDFLPPLQALLQQYCQPRQRYRLAAEIIGLFKQYLHERPELIAAWQTESGTYADMTQTQSHRHWAWQRDLFNQLSLSKFNRDALIQSFHDALPAANDLPQQVHVFGFHALPVTQLTDLLALATQTEVSFYVFNPSVTYWQDIVPERIKYRSQLTAENEAALMTVGHPLLAAWGQGGKYLIERLNEYDYQQLAAVTIDANHENNPCTGILSQLQNSIERLTEPDTTQWQQVVDAELNTINAQVAQGGFDFPSISLHVASSPRREVEVLFDNLLSLLAANDALQASDILVMLPNLPDYAPHIQAVFGTVQRQGQAVIPFSLANQKAAEADSDVQAFLSLLRVVESDFQAQVFFECLNEQPLRQRFALQQMHLQTIRRWLLDSHFSGDFYDQSQGKFSSLEKLLDNLLLAYTADTDGYVESRVAAPFYQTQQQETLSIFADIIGAFRQFSRLASQSQRLSDWFIALQRLAMQFLPMPNGSNAVTEHLSTWFDSFSTVEIDEVFDYATVLADIETMLQGEELHGPFLSGGVSFCAVMPMRAIPAKIICLLGVGRDFPVVEAKKPLDLRRLRPRWSDYRPAKESRYFFLESLMAAREKLYLSYTGLNEKSGKRSPPSVLVSELLDFITRQLPEQNNYLRKLQFDYPLQGFMSNQMQSYQSIYETPTDTDNTILGEDSLATETLSQIWQAKQLAAAMAEPFLFYLQTVLQSQPLNDLAQPLREHRLLSLDNGLDLWRYKAAILDTAIDDSVSNFSLLQRLQQQNLYAPTAISQPLIQTVSESMQPLITAVQEEQLSKGKSLVTVMTHHLQGQDYHFLFNGKMTDEGLISYAAGGLTGKRLLTAWVEHILFNLLDAEQYAIRTYHSSLLTQDKAQLTRTQFAAFESHTAAKTALEQVIAFVLKLTTRPYPFKYRAKSYQQHFTYQTTEYPLYERLLAAQTNYSADEMNALFEPIAATMQQLRGE